MSAFTQDDLKKLAAARAVEMVHSGMVLGLGTGSTSRHAVNLIGERLNAGSLEDIIGVPTSSQTASQAQKLGIPLTTLDEHPVLDLAIDGADEVDGALNLVKGRGGALLREKMVESAAKRFLVIVDDSKMVQGLGTSGAMPVEVVPFCWRFTRQHLAALSSSVERREDGGVPFVTDNGNFILDCFFDHPISDPAELAAALMAMPGVVEHGLFLGMADTVIVASPRGIEILEK